MWSGNILPGLKVEIRGGWGVVWVTFEVSGWQSVGGGDLLSLLGSVACCRELMGKDSFQLGPKGYKCWMCWWGSGRGQAS